MSHCDDGGIDLVIDLAVFEFSAGVFDKSDSERALSNCARGGMACAAAGGRCKCCARTTVACTGAHAGAPPRSVATSAPSSQQRTCAPGNRRREARRATATRGARAQSREARTREGLADAGGAASCKCCPWGRFSISGSLEDSFSSESRESNCSGVIQEAATWPPESR